MAPQTPRRGGTCRAASPSLPARNKSSKAAPGDAAGTSSRKELAPTAARLRSPAPQPGDFAAGGTAAPLPSSSGNAALKLPVAVSPLPWLVSQFTATDSNRSSARAEPLAAGQGPGRTAAAAAAATPAAAHPGDQPAPKQQLAAPASSGRSLSPAAAVGQGAATAACSAAAACQAAEAAAAGGGSSSAEALASHRCSADSFTSGLSGLTVHPAVFCLLPFDTPQPAAGTAPQPGCSTAAGRSNSSKQWKLPLLGFSSWRSRAGPDKHSTSSSNGNSGSPSGAAARAGAAGTRRLTLEERLLLAAEVLSSSGHLQELRRSVDDSTSSRRHSSSSSSSSSSPTSHLGGSRQASLSRSPAAAAIARLARPSADDSSGGAIAPAVRMSPCIEGTESLHSGGGGSGGANGSDCRAGGMQQQEISLAGHVDGGASNAPVSAVAGGPAVTGAAAAAIAPAAAGMYSPVALAAWVQQWESSFDMQKLGTVGSCDTTTDLTQWQQQQQQQQVRRTASMSSVAAAPLGITARPDAAERLQLQQQCGRERGTPRETRETAFEDFQAEFEAFGSLGLQAADVHCNLQGSSSVAGGAADALLQQQLRIAEELLRRHGLLDAYQQRTQQLLAASSGAAGQPPAAVGVGGGSGRGSFSGFGFTALGRAIRSRLVGKAAATQVSSATGSNIGHQPAGAPASSLSTAPAGSAGPSSSGSRSSLPKKAVLPSSSSAQQPQAAAAPAAAAVWQPGPQDLRPLVTVWSPVACLLVAVYLAATGYYLYIRAAMSTSMGFQAWYSLVVLAVEVVGVSSMAPYAAMLVRYSRSTGSRGLPASGSCKLPLPENKRFHVRVLVPCYKESLGTITATVDAALSADLPPGCRRHVYLCDDGKDPSKQEWAASKASHGVVYVSGRSRAPGEINGKSGNLNNALRNVVFPEFEGRPADIPALELVVVFDADIAAKKNFFTKVLEVMWDDEAALCLTPQAFHNIDPAADIFNHVNPQFWQYVLPGCDSLGYVGCTGTNVCIRARCLGTVGWFPEWTITEDYALSMELKMAGFRGRYLPEYLAVGEAPDELRNVMRQRSRWCKGHMQVFFSSKCPLLPRRLSLVHKLLYTNGTWAYFATILTTITFTMVPFNSLVFGFHPVTFSRRFALASTAYLVAGAALGGFVRRPAHSRGMYLSGISNFLLTFTYAKAVLNTLLSKVGFKDVAGFKATAKRIVAAPMKAAIVHIAQLSVTAGRALSSMFQHGLASLTAAGGVSRSSPRRGSILGGQQGGLFQRASVDASDAPGDASVRVSVAAGRQSLPPLNLPAAGGMAVAAAAASPAVRESFSGFSSPGKALVAGPTSHSHSISSTSQLSSPFCEATSPGVAVLSPGRVSLAGQGFNGFSSSGSPRGSAAVAKPRGSIPSHVLLAVQQQQQQQHEAPLPALSEDKKAAAGAGAAEEELPDSEPTGCCHGSCAWAATNISGLDGVLDPLFLAAALAVSLCAIAAGAQQAAAEGSSFSLARVQSVVKVFTSGRMDEFMLLAMLWAAVNSVPPILFFVYIVTKGRLLRWAVTAGQLGSLVLGAAATACLWLLIPVDIQPAALLPAVSEFLTIQWSGPGMPNSTLAALPWLRPSGLSDPIPGGFYVNGADFVKHSMPLAGSMALLAWSLLEFGSGFQAAGVREQLLQTLSHGTRYLIDCHVSAEAFVVQIGDPADYAVDVARGVGSWGPPDASGQLPGNRSLHVITRNSTGGSDALAAAAAALAAASVALPPSALATEALSHSQQLYRLALNLNLLSHSFCDSVVACRGTAVPTPDPGAVLAAAVSALQGSSSGNATAEVAWVAFPSSSIFYDMAWAAAWLHKATGTGAYLADAEVFLKLHLQQEARLTQPDAWAVTLDNMAFATGLLLQDALPPGAAASHYRELPAALLRGWMLGKNNWTTDICRPTPSGFLWSTGAAAAPAHSVAGVGLMALLFASVEARSSSSKAGHSSSSRRRLVRNLECFALKQAESLVGGQMGRDRSYVVGTGPSWPLRPQHRQASCPAPTADADDSSRCSVTSGLLSSLPNPHTLTGALVAGPDADDSFADDRTNTAQSGVSLAGNVMLAGLLGGLADRGVSPGPCYGGRGFFQNVVYGYAP